MSWWWFGAACLVAALELVLLVVTGARLRRTRGHTRRLERELDRILEQSLERGPGRGRRRPTPRIPSTRDAVKAVWETAALMREQGVGPALRRQLQHSIDDLAGWAQVERPDLERLAAGDGSVAILFSDIEDSTALNDELGDRAWVKVLGSHETIVRRCADQHSGHVVKAQGDGFMLAFGPASDAIGCAVDMQRALTSVRPRRGAAPIRVRIGIHRGRAVRREGDLFGRNVAYAARVAGLAEGGEILVSDAVVESLVTSGAAELLDEAFEEGREVELKGLSGQHRVHRIVWDPQEAPPVEAPAEEADEAVGTTPDDVTDR